MAPDTLRSATRDPVEYVTPAELAAELRVGLNVVYRAIHGGEIADVKRPGGRHFRIPRKSADAWINGSTVGPVAP